MMPLNYGALGRLGVQVRVRFVGFLARKVGKEVVVEVAEGTTLAAAVRQVVEGYGLGAVDAVHGGGPGALTILLNGRARKPQVKLRDGDEVAFLPTIAGG